MKTLLITGGTGNLGTFLVDRLKRQYNCVLVTRGDDPAKAVDRQFYGLVHLIGGFVPGSVVDTSTDAWHQMMESNVTAAFNIIHAALPKIERPGRIVAISSIASIEKFKGAAAYIVSKSALNALIEVTAAETGGSGITVNALLPSTLDTPAMRDEMPKARRVPLDRVADSILFLLSEEAANITGALIPLRA